MTALTQALISGVLLGGVYALMSSGLSLIFGVMGLVNFAQAAFTMLAMYGTFYLWQIDIPPLAAVVLIAPLGLVVGALVHAVILRHVTGAKVNQDAQLILTWGLALTLEYGAQLVFSPTPRVIRTGYSGESWYVAGVLISKPRVYAFVVAAVLAAFLFYLVRRTMLGAALRATADDWEESVYVGIPVRRLEALAFGIGVAVSCVAGVLLAVQRPVEPFVGHQYLIIMFVAVVLGGLGNVLGGMIGGLAVGVVESLALFYLPAELAPVTVFVLFVAVLLLRPSGLAGQRLRAV